MTRKEVRDYIRQNPADNEAWEIFFQKIENSPKQEIKSDRELIKIIQLGNPYSADKLNPDEKEYQNYFEFFQQSYPSEEFLIVIIRKDFGRHLGVGIMNRSTEATATVWLKHGSKPIDNPVTDTIQQTVKEHLLHGNGDQEF